MHYHFNSLQEFYGVIFNNIAIESMRENDI